jgi:hypothetical protein
MKIYELTDTWYIIPAVSIHKEIDIYISVMFLKWELEFKLW